MRKINRIVLLLILIITFQLSNSFLFAQGCQKNQITKSINQFIASSPYKYDSHSVNEFVFDKIEKKFEVQFTAFKGLKYKILFSTSGYEEDIEINIFDQSTSSKKTRNTLMDNTQKRENSYWVFETEKSGKYYIEYTIPKSITEEQKNGCILTVIAYSEK